MTSTATAAIDRPAAQNGGRHGITTWRLNGLEAASMEATGAILRALWGYFSLVFISRVVGRRPGKQLTPFEFVLIFFLGGLTLTGMVGPQASSTNAVIQILTIACGHTFLVWLRTKSSWAARILDGTPLLLLEGNTWRSRTLQKMRISPHDVMAMARDQGLKTLDEVDTATLERNGEISIIPRKDL